MCVIVCVFESTINQQMNLLRRLSLSDTHQVSDQYIRLLIDKRSDQFSAFDAVQLNILFLHQRLQLRPSF